MSVKTNKSFTKRLKVTRNGKLVGRKPGQNHFNAKASRRSQLKKRRNEGYEMNAKNRGRFLPHA